MSIDRRVALRSLDVWGEREVWVAGVVRVRLRRAEAAVGGCAAGRGFRGGRGMVYHGFRGRGQALLAVG
ncbi:hypothetical protein ACFV2Z_36150, partial [Streptomyces sp. NPDC059688]|uniref:hypothetical protein n=1 Tax=Streptomyces sp. NPDC059688 TaxID=3346906 RepID=UPI00367574BF